MIFKNQTENFVYERPSASKGWSVFALCTATYYLAFSYANPFFQKHALSLVTAPLFIKHLIYFSFVTTLICAAVFWLLKKEKIFKKVDCFFNRRVVIEGLVVGIFCSLLTIPFALNHGYHLGFSLDLEKMLGNLFSNTYEEFQYRVFIFFAALYAFRKVSIAAIISGLAFAWSHGNYPIDIQAVIFLTGTLTAVAYYRTGSFLTAVLVHQVVDMILDTILIS